MSSFSPPAESGGPGANTQATAPFPDCWPPPAVDSHLRISRRLPKHPLLTVLQHRNGQRAGHISWKEGGKWERRRRRPRPATASALHPPPPLLYGISQALTCRDPGQFLFRLLFSSAAGPPALRVIESWYSDGNNDQDKKDFCTRQLLVT